MQFEGQQLEGRLVRWNDDNGFGFIRIDGMKQDVFIHISALRNMPRRPCSGDVIEFVLKRDAQGRLGAEQAVIRGLTPVAPGQKGNPVAQRKNYRIAGRPLGGFGWFVLTSVAVFSLWALYLDNNPVPLLVYAGMSLITFIAYAMDKKKAIDGRWRTPESMLHLLELAGGWPGGLIAQFKMRHKNRKERYQFVFWAIVFLHLMMWADYLLLSGRWIWQPLRSIGSAFLL